MKKLLLTLCAFTISLGAFSQGGYLHNSGFENWTINTIYENPTSWGSSNYENGNPVIGATKTTDAQHLTYAAQVENVLVNGTDTAFSYVYLGEIGSGGPNRGIPYSSSVNRINGFYKGTIGTNDTAIVLVIKFMGGTMVSMDLGQIFTSQSSYTAFTFNLTAVPQDSIFVGLISTNPFVSQSHASFSTVVKFDNISLSHSTLGAGAALPNNSFENWTPVQSETPDGWESFNNFTAVYGLEPITKSTDMNAGSFAAQIETIEFFGDTIPGMLFYGELDNNMNPSPIPYTASPVTLTGFYKYSPSNADQAAVSFEFYNSGMVVGGNQLILTPAGSYTSFSVATNITSTPDSMLLVFYSGDNAGSILKVDDVQFTGGDLSVNDVFTFNYGMYPNPATDQINISGNMNGVYQISITDLTGKLILTEMKNSMQSTVDVRHLTSGIYNLTIETNGNSVTKSISIVR